MQTAITFLFPICVVLFHLKLIGAAQGWKLCGMTAVRVKHTYIYFWGAQESAGFHKHFEILGVC
jgi:hypothetical protein